MRLSCKAYLQVALPRVVFTEGPEGLTDSHALALPHWSPYNTFHTACRTRCTSCLSQRAWGSRAWPAPTRRGRLLQGVLGRAWRRRAHELACMHSALRFRFRTGCEYLKRGEDGGRLAGSSGSTSSESCEPEYSDHGMIEAQKPHLGAVTTKLQSKLCTQLPKCTSFQSSWPRLRLTLHNGPGGQDKTQAEGLHRSATTTNSSAGSQAALMQPRAPLHRRWNDCVVSHPLHTR